MTLRNTGTLIGFATIAAPLIAPSMRRAMTAAQIYGGAEMYRGDDGKIHV